MARSKSSGRWLREHFDDEFVKRAQREGARSRAVYKLEELDKKYRLLRPGMNIVDLGAAPGGWSQYAAHKLQGKGRIVALDILPMDPLGDVDFILGDFRRDEVLAKLQETLDGAAIDLVLSDMAPNMSGVDAVDQPGSMYLVELATEFAGESLRKGGSFLTKVFQGEGFDAWLRDVRRQYDKVIVRKPKASRPRSREVYLLATGKKL